MRRFGALIFLLAACGGGGGGGGTSITFSLLGVAPAVSTDLSGGDTVTITGTNFITASVSNVTFGGVAATNRVILSETEMTVDTPAAPGGVPQSVTVVVSTVYGGSEQLVDGYTYASSAPNPLSISPTIFTPTGAEDFTITGTALGPLGGQVSVIFQGIGSVTGTVSANGQSVTGRAPVAITVPPVGPITVTVDTGAATADVPVTVTYPYVPPLPIPAPGQILGGASQPVRLADGFAAYCTAGGDGNWNTADDDIQILGGPPGGIAQVSVAPRAAPGTPVGYLSPVNSIPAVLGPDTFAVYGLTAAGATQIWLVTLARTAPVADPFPMASMSPAPISAIGPSRIAFTRVGTFLPGPLDELTIQDFNLVPAPPALATTIRVAIPIVDPTVGAGNFSIPFSPDGDSVFSMDMGLNGTAGNADDLLVVHVVSGGTTNTVPAPSLLGRPIAFSASLLAAPAAGVNGTFADPDDTLHVFSLAGTWGSAPLALGQPLHAVLRYARAGNSIAVALAGGIKVYTSLPAGTNTIVAFPGAPLFGQLGGGGLVAFGPGPNLVPMTGGDDQAVLLDSAGTPQSFSQIPQLTQTVLPLTDLDRAFALSPGANTNFATGDEVLEVYQSRAIAATNSACRLPAPAPGGAVTAGVAFVPIGPGWGVFQSPGPDGIFGPLNGADDTLVLVRY